MKIWVIEKYENSYRGILFKKQRNKYEIINRNQKIILKNIKGQRAYIINTCKNPYLSREILNTTRQEELITLQLKDKLEETGIYEKEPWITYKIERNLDEQIEVIFAATEKECFLSILEDACKNMIRVEKLIPDFLAIPWLTICDTDENILSLYLDENKFYIFLTGKNKILFFRKIDIDPLTGPKSKVIEENILASLDYCDSYLKEPVEKILAYGPKKDDIPANIIPLYQPKFENFENIEQELILKEPYFFGALLVPDSFNFLPDNHKTFLKHLKIIRNICILLMVGTLFNYGLWFNYKPKINYIETELSQLRKELNEKEKLLRQELINEKEKIEYFNKINTILIKANKSLNIEELIDWILREIKVENIIKIEGKKIEVISEQNYQEGSIDTFIIKLHLTKKINDNTNKELNKLYNVIKKKIKITSKEIKTENGKVNILITGIPKK